MLGERWGERGKRERKERERWHKTVEVLIFHWPRNFGITPHDQTMRRNFRRSTVSFVGYRLLCSAPLSSNHTCSPHKTSAKGATPVPLLGLTRGYRGRLHFECRLHRNVRRFEVYLGLNDYGIPGPAGNFKTELQYGTRWHFKSCSVAAVSYNRPTEQRIPIGCAMNVAAVFILSH